MPVRLSEHELSQNWLLQFSTSRDRALAAQLLNQLKLVASREFESGITGALAELQQKVDATIAVYPVAPPISDDVAGYGPFSGAVAQPSLQARSREIGRRRKYGSEDRVGHMLARFQDKFRRPNNVSTVECQPTLTQLKTQGIRHIVLVDDICGSGKRITDYWRHSVPRRIKSLLSLKKCELWIVVYAITDAGRKRLQRALPNFPIKDHLISILPETDFLSKLSPEVVDLCNRYAVSTGMYGVNLGYLGATSNVVFEHGCPNNVPAILWANKSRWSGLFPNRFVPSELRTCFDAMGADLVTEQLWRSNQPTLALRLIEALEKPNPIEPTDWLLLSMLGLRLRGVSESNLSGYHFITQLECDEILKRAIDAQLYDGAKSVTSLGKELVTRFRQRNNKGDRISLVVDNCARFYPSQCEGTFREAGKTVRR